MKAPGSVGGWRYLPGFLGDEEGAWLLDWLLHARTWRAEEVRLFGRTHVVPRQVDWCGDEGVSYRYSGQDHPSHGWPLPLEQLRDRITREIGTRYNFVLLNRYRCGADRMGWHRDDEPMNARMVASLSVGAPRRFLIRPQRDQPSVRLTLEHGSLLLMDRFFTHALPRTSRTVGERVNLSFRSLPCGI